MGKRIIAQARGKGGPRYRAPGHTFKGMAVNKKLKPGTFTGEVLDIVKCRAHSTPLVAVKFDDGDTFFMPGVEGVKVGDRLEAGDKAIAKAGNTLALKDIPEGTLINNIELNPGDGGKFVRASGTFAKIVSKSSDKITIILPSKKQKILSPKCRATIGVLAGGGRPEKPLLKAGVSFYKMRAKNKLWPKVCGQSMNAVDHPHGGSRSSMKNYPYAVSRNAPPGAKVGSISARRTGRKKK
ncbi:50S ribosomal protein L2 [Candidatus Woesearchaeota archaeon]|nr:50S ribosomal protein L2 [Candidatus Woesearchaeota archaeon]MBW3021528.1 50S ribosomal protein L2 [Candidatus Woesearchaeota archaeon]